MQVTLDRIEFYITNVCNYNCDNCNRLNNYYFSGHQKWNDYKQIYEQWSKVINFRSEITILGGEPFLNPTMPDWVKGIRQLWPNIRLQLLTNGSRLGHVKNLYELLLENKVVLNIQTHNSNKAIHQSIVNQVLNLLKGPIKRTHVNEAKDLWLKTYKEIKGDTWPECYHIDDFYKLPEWIQEECTKIHGINPDSFFNNTSGVEFEDINGVTVIINYAENFVKAPLKYTGDNKFSVYNSRPEKAHEVCISKHCHHFSKGKLYKCHHVMLLPEFMEQFQVDITDEGKELLYSYKPLLPDQSMEEIKKFVNDLPFTIPQCKLCPEDISNNHKLEATTKKIKIVKLQTIK